MYGTIKIIGEFSKNAPKVQQEALHGLVVKEILCTTSAGIPVEEQQTKKKGIDRGIGVPLKNFLVALRKSDVPKENKDFWIDFFSATKGYNTDSDVLFFPDNSFSVLEKANLSPREAYREHTGVK